MERELQTSFDSTSPKTSVNSGVTINFCTHSVFTASTCSKAVRTVSAGTLPPWISSPNCSDQVFPFRYGKRTLQRSLPWIGCTNFTPVCWALKST